MTNRFRASLALAAAAIAFPIAGAFAPTQLQAAPASGSYQPGVAKVQPMFLKHILAITDVLNQCGKNPGSNPLVSCPLIAPRKTAVSGLRLY